MRKTLLTPTSGTTSAPTPDSPGKSDYSGSLMRSLREYGLLFALIIIMAFFQYSTSGTLMEPLNLTNLILQNSYIVIMALGMLMVIVAGHIDLSVGSSAGFIGALAALLMAQWNVNPIIATIACVVAGAIIGAAQGYFVAFWRMPSFIVTLAGMLVFRGLTITALQGQSIGPFPDGFAAISSGFIPDIFHGEHLRITSFVLGLLVGLSFFVIEFRHRRKSAQHGMASSSVVMFVVKNAVIMLLIAGFCYLLASYRGMPTVLVIMSVLIGIYTFVMNRTTIGRRVYAVGGNVKAAKLSGVNTERVTFFAFVNMGMLAALAGLIFAARLDSATPKAGTGFELDVIAACFIGGASASGGVGKVMGAVIGAFIMLLTGSLLSFMNVSTDWQLSVQGAILIVVLGMRAVQRRRA